MLSSSHGKRATLLTTLLAANAVTRQPVVGARVMVQTWYGSPLMSGQTDAQGTYEVVLSRGIYRVGVATSGYQSTSRLAVIRGGQSTLLDLSLQPTAPPPPTPTYTPVVAPPPPTPTSTPTPVLPPPPPLGSQPKITFAASGTTYDVLTVNPDGSGATDLTPNTQGSSEHDPAWSPDRSRIVFASDVTGVNYLYVVNTDGTGLRQLTFGYGSDNHQA